MEKRLHRSKTNRIVAGVCGGIAETYGFDPSIVRIIAALLMLTWGTGIVLYIIACICIPEADA